MIVNNSPFSWRYNLKEITPYRAGSECSLECEGCKDGVRTDLLRGVDDAQAVSHLQRAKRRCEHCQSECAC